MAADHHSAANLKTQCLNFFRDKDCAARAFESTGFADLQAQRPSLLIEIMKAMNSTNEIRTSRKRAGVPHDERGRFKRQRR